MRKIDAFETTDNKKFFDEGEARTHERRYDFGNLVDRAVHSNPQFAKLDREMLIDFFMKYGSDIGKLADSPILPVAPSVPLKKFDAPRAPAVPTAPMRAIPEPTASGTTSRAVPPPPSFDEFSKTLEDAVMRELALDEERALSR